MGRRVLLVLVALGASASGATHPSAFINVTERYFGLGRREAVDLAVVFHPSGKRVRRTGVEPGTTVELREE